MVQFRSLCFIESKARDFEKLTGRVLTSIAFLGKPSRKSVQGLVKTCFEMYAVDLTESTRQLSSTDVLCSLA